MWRKAFSSKKKKFLEAVGSVADFNVYFSVSSGSVAMPTGSLVVC